MKKSDFILVGVGGQGTLLASDVLALVGLEHGYDVKKSEVHGMAQRGGSVVSHVRWAEKVYSPLIGKGEADFLLSFEKLEALRHLGFIRIGSAVIVNDYAIPPVSVASGEDVYPDDQSIRQVLSQVTAAYHLVPGSKTAEELGNARTSNIVLLGALSTFLDVPAATWEKIIGERVPQKFVELNLKAFNAGRSLLGT